MSKKVKKAIDIDTNDYIIIGDTHWEVWDCWGDWDRKIMKIFLIYEEGWEARRKKIEVPFNEELQVL